MTWMAPQTKKSSLKNTNTPKSVSKTRSMVPRLIRLRDAPNYLGMDPNRFNAEVRPYLIEIPIGKQGIAFDRLDLDRMTEYKAATGVLGRL